MVGGSWNACFQADSAARQMTSNHRRNVKIHRRFVEQNTRLFLLKNLANPLTEEGAHAKILACDLLFSPRAVEATRSRSRLVLLLPGRFFLSLYCRGTRLHNSLPSDN